MNQTQLVGKRKKLAVINQWLSQSSPGNRLHGEADFRVLFRRRLRRVGKQETHMLQRGLCG